MGSCVSSRKIPDSASVANNDEKLMIPAPVPKPDGADRTLSQLALDNDRCPSSPFRHAGSKEETFFDSQPWLESDCEDDFLSINADFTPSGGSTPIHDYSLSLQKTPKNEATVVEGKHSVPVPVYEQSRPPHLPHENKRLLSELFKESSRNHLYTDDENVSGNVVPAKSKAAPAAVAAEAATGSSPVLRELINNRTPSNSGGSSERTTPNHHHNNGMVTETDDKSGKSAQCCLPRLVSSRSLNDRKKRATPAHTRAA